MPSPSPASAALTASLLLVDDEPGILQFLTDLFLGSYDVRTARDGEEALAALRERNVDVVITDIAMPRLDGIGLLAAVKQLPTRPDVILMTGNADVDTAISALKQGAYDFVRKPFDIDEILFAVERTMEKRTLQAQAARYRDTLEAMVDDRTRAYRELLLATLQSLVRTLEFKDRYTKHHSESVARYASALARAAGLSEEMVQRVATAGLLHDIGKIGIRDSVLTKPGRLTAEEFGHVKLHPVIGAEILDPVLADDAIIAGVRHHHESLDGRGYPEGLAGDRIPLIARVLAIADSYDAMRSRRAYREARDHAAVLEVIEGAAGTQFDPELVAIFLGLDFEAIVAAPPPQPTLPFQT